MQNRGQPLQAKHYSAGCGAGRCGTGKGPENEARPEEGKGPTGPDRVRDVRPSLAEASPPGPDRVPEASGRTRPGKEMPREWWN